MENGQDDVATHLLRLCACAEHPYLNLEAIVQMESSYFNPDVGQYEPLLEPWEIVMRVEQQLPFLALFVTMVSDKMINLNLTYGSTLCFKKIMQKTDFNAIEEEKFDNPKDREA